MLNLLVGMAVVVLGALGPAPLTRTPWEVYVDDPTPQNAKAVTEMSYARPLTEEKKMEAIETDLDVLETEVISGDREAVRLAFRLFEATNGHVAELLSQIVGRLIRIQPRLFLQELRHAWPVPRLDALVGALGDAFVDREEAQKYELAARAAALKQVQDSSLRKVRDACLIELTK
jgi:hypothetical protein